MKSIEQLTRMARLTVASPEFVYAELKTYSAEVQADAWTVASEPLESMLAARNDPLIDLGLAAYGSDPTVVGAIYAKGIAEGGDGALKEGLRLAVLANETVDARSFLERFPSNVIGEEETRRVLHSADYLEARTLLVNPVLDDRVLQELYNGDKLAEGMADDRRRELVMASANNPRLGIRKESEDGPDMGHYYIQKAILGLLETAPTTKRWMHALSYLLERLAPGQTWAGEAGIDHILERWKVDEAGNAEEPSDGDRCNATGLTDREEFRCLIAALYGKSYGKKKAIHGAADDEDAAKRCAYYGNADLDVKALQAGYEKDRDVFTFAAMLNDDILHKRKERKFFEEECLHGGFGHRYRRRCEQLHKGWRSFDPRPVAEWMAITEVEQVKPATERQVADLAVRVGELQKLAGYAPWVVIILVATAVWRG